VDLPSNSSCRPCTYRSRRHVDDLLTASEQSVRDVPPDSLTALDRPGPIRESPAVGEHRRTPGDLVGIAAAGRAAPGRVRALRHVACWWGELSALGDLGWASLSTRHAVPSAMTRATAPATMCGHFVPSAKSSYSSLDKLAGCAYTCLLYGGRAQRMDWARSEGRHATACRVRESSPCVGNKTCRGPPARSF
jgi:hypothetical protein